MKRKTRKIHLQIRRIVSAEYIVVENFQYNLESPGYQLCEEITRGKF